METKFENNFILIGIILMFRILALWLHYHANFVFPKCPAGGAVFWQTLLRPVEAERDICSQPEYSTGPC